MVIGIVANAEHFIFEFKRDWESERGELSEGKIENDVWMMNEAMQMCMLHFYILKWNILYSDFLWCDLIS